MLNTASVSCCLTSFFTVLVFNTASVFRCANSFLNAVVMQRGVEADAYEAKDVVMEDYTDDKVLDKLFDILTCLTRM